MLFIEINVNDESLVLSASYSSDIFLVLTTSFSWSKHYIQQDTQFISFHVHLSCSTCELKQNKGIIWTSVSQNIIKVCLEGFQCLCYLAKLCRFTCCRHVSFRLNNVLHLHFRTEIQTIFSGSEWTKTSETFKQIILNTNKFPQNESCL